MTGDSPLTGSQDDKGHPLAGLGFFTDKNKKSRKIFGTFNITSYLCGRNKVRHRARAPFVSASDLLMLILF